MAKTTDCDIVSLACVLLLCCVVELKIVITINQCYLCFSASTRATPKRAGSHCGGPSLGCTLLHSPASSQARLVRFPICKSRSGSFGPPLHHRRSRLPIAVHLSPRLSRFLQPARERPPSVRVRKPLSIPCYRLLSSAFRQL